MGKTENYEELKESTKTFLQIITSNDFYYGIFLLVVMIVLIKVLDFVFKPLIKRGSAFGAFIKACLKVFVIVLFGLRIVALIPGFESFTSQILMSSSLIVVVLGFVFQEGLSNIVHGFILSVFKPFALGDRISVVIDGEKITGYVREINSRHTVIENVLNSAHVIVPNSKLDTSVIVNNYFDGNKTSSAFLDVDVTYESDLEKAIAILSEEIGANPLVKKAMEDKGIEGPVGVMVRDLGVSGISLRASVLTHTVEENFTACSDIRRAIVKRVESEKDVSFAYPHVEIVQEKSKESE